MVARDDRFVMGQSIREVDVFLGLKAEETGMLPPEDLVRRLDWILSAAQRYLRQLPDSEMSQELSGRPRSYRQLSHHVFQITRAFLTAATGGTLTQEEMGQAPADELKSFADIAEDGEGARQALLAWWKGTGRNTDFETSVSTYYGAQPLHDVLERTVWHTAQHVRQLMYILDRLNIAADGPLSDHELSGLPLPKEVWDG